MSFLMSSDFNSPEHLNFTKSYAVDSFNIYLSTVVRLCHRTFFAVGLGL